MDVENFVAVVLLDKLIPFDGCDHVAECIDVCHLVVVDVVAVVVWIL